MTTPTVPAVPQAQPAERARRLLRAAWWAVGLLPLAVVAAFVTGSGLLSLQGYEPDDEDIPLSAILTSAVPAMCLVVACSLVALVCGLKARRLGNSRGLLPALIGGIAGIGFTLQNLLAYILG